MRLRVSIVAVMGAVTLAALMPALAQADQAAPWLAGAAKVDTTPPVFNAQQDLQDFPEVDPNVGTCLRTVYSGPRLWRFEEPYQDQDNSGDFSYDVSGDPGTTPVPEPFCDYNHNGRWDGIYLSGGTDHKAVYSDNPISGSGPAPAHDPIDARAVAFSDGSKTIVLVSVVAQGLFQNYTAEMRQQAAALAQTQAHAACGHIDGMVVSANHNESSPDTVGLYGAPEDPTGSFGVNSGIDEYYMDWLNSQVAQAAVDACDNRAAATMREVEFPVPSDLRQEVPNRFPTADDAVLPAATDPKVRVLQARDAAGKPIFTMMNLADHNQDIGQSNTFEVSHTMSSDWPGYFHRRLEADLAQQNGGSGGMAMFLAADIGSMEDLITVPELPGPPCNSGDNGCYPQVEATGTSIADHVDAELANAKPVAPGPVSAQHTEFDVPIENQLFKAAAAAGIFGERQAYTGGQPSGRTGTDVHTEVNVLNVGPDLQFIGDPGEAFPVLMLGSPFGIEDAGCPTRVNPPIPTWHASARYRFQIGLADDLIGYMKPAWSFSDQQPPNGAFTPNDNCFNDSSNRDVKGHHHSLEGEGVGPTAGNLVGQKLTDLLNQHPDPTAKVRLGRYIRADGTLTAGHTNLLYTGPPGHFPTDAVGIWLADPGSTTLDPNDPHSGTIIGTSAAGSFGNRVVDGTGSFMDYDGATQSGPDVTTRGMLVKVNGNVGKRYYVDVYPALNVPDNTSLGAAQPAAADLTISKDDSADPATAGQQFHYTLTAHNNGPNTAQSVKLTDQLPGGIQYDSSSASKGSCSESAGTVSCDLGDLTSGQTETATITVTPVLTAQYENTASITSDTTDPSGPNSDSESTTVQLPPPPPGACANEIDGDAGDNVLNGTSAGDRIKGLAGDDRINGRGGADCIYGGSGSDRMHGGRGNDRISGLGGADVLYGDRGRDTLYGRPGNDRLVGGPGLDSFHAGAGDDVVNSKDGRAETVDCGSGQDIAIADSRDTLIDCERVR